MGRGARGGMGGGLEGEAGGDQEGVSVVCVLVTVGCGTIAGTVGGETGGQASRDLVGRSRPGGHGEAWEEAGWPQELERKRAWTKCRAAKFFNLYDFQIIVRSCIAAK